MSKIAIFLADGFEEIEGLTSVDMCRRAGIEVTTVSVMETKKIMGSHKIPVEADAMFNEVNFDDMDLLLLPGGGLGTENLEKHAGLAELLKKADSQGKKLAAICAAPRVLGQLGLLNGIEATCYPGNEDKLKGAVLKNEKKAVRDGRFVTGKGMGASIEFAAEVISLLEGEEKAGEILKQIQFA
ncbi:MAG: DJ-1/PfpI family protein [Lachnospiraceae bacterium]|nr:DJ-1/PfpI family protein [Lachnospiraceae bacterium]